MPEENSTKTLVVDELTAEPHAPGSGFGAAKVAIRLKNSRDLGKQYVTEVLVVADGAVSMGRKLGSRLLDRVQFALYRWRLALDPETREWIRGVDLQLAEDGLPGSTSRADFERRIAKERSKAG